MKTTLKTAMALALMLSSVAAVHAGDARKAPAKKAPAKAAAEVKCPVMGGKVADIKKAPKSTYKGKTYYFCCPGCKPTFDKDPAKYAKASPK